MNEFVEKLIGRLEELKKRNTGCYGIACIKCKYDNECHEGEKDYKVVLDESIKIVNQLAEEYNNGWIPVSDKLPREDMWCLATFESGGIDKIQYLVTNKWGWNGEFADNKVVAWMPLPEPFKPKGD